MSVSHIKVSLLGTPMISPPGRKPIPLERKAGGLLFLAARRPATSRAAAAALLWPDVNAATARTNLRVTAYRLHRLVGYRLFEDINVLALVGCEDDVSTSLHRPLTKESALEMLSKPLLDGFRFDDCSEMSVLIEHTQSALYDHAEREVHRLWRELIAAGNVQEADVTFLSEAFAMRPLAERVAADLMEHRLRLGDRSGGLAIYERLRSSMILELGVNPSPETQRLHGDMLQAVPADPRRDERLGGRADDRTDFRLVEREFLLERLWQTAASGRHIWIEGEAGIGKSRLVREFARAYRKVCFVRLKPGQEHQSYSFMRQLVFQLRDMLHLTQYPPVLRYFARIKVGKSRGPDSSLGAIEEIAFALFRTLVKARQAGLEILVVDDCHEIDGSSAAVLANLISGLEHPRRDVKDEVPTLVFAGRGDALSRASTKLWNACRSTEYWQDIQLESITASGIAQMMDQAGMTFEQIGLTNEELRRRTGGNPFFVTELLREASWGQALTPKWIPGAVSALFRQRISILSEEGFFVLEIALSAGSDFEPAMVEEVRDWQPGHLLQAWTELRRVGLFGVAGFAHDLARAATEAELSGPARRELHRKIAQYLQANALPERVAHHLILGGRHSDALPLAVTAARRLVTEYSFQEALTLLQRALQKQTSSEALHIRSARFAASCLVAHCLTLLNGPGGPVKSVTATLPSLATSPIEELIAECWIVQALLEDPMPPGAGAVVRRDRPEGDSVWNWSLQISHCNAWIALRDFDQAAKILPRAPDRSNEACWDFGLHSFGQYTYCLVGLGMLSQAETFTASYQLPAQTSYLKYALRSSIAEERGDLHSATYWKRQLLEGFVRSHHDVPVHLIALTTLRLAMCELRRGHMLAARTALQAVADGGSEAVRNDKLLAEAMIAEISDDDVGYRRARKDTRLDIDPDVYLHIYWIDTSRALSKGEVASAEKIYTEGLQRIRELNFLSCNAYRLLGCRFDEPAVAIAKAEGVLKSAYNQERVGLLALAQLEIALASLRMDNIPRAEQALLEMHHLPFLGFAYILLPDEFLHTTLSAVKQCRRKSLSDFAKRLQAMIRSIHYLETAELAGRMGLSTLDRPLASA